MALEFSDEGEDIVANPAILRSHAELVDGCADPLNDAIDFGHRRPEFLRQLSRNPSRHALKLEPDAEEPLNHGVVQVAGDPVPILVDGHDPDLLMESGILDGDAGGEGEHLDQRLVVVREL